jgi:hypothetical protein
MARDIPPESLAALQAHFSRLSSAYLASSPASSPASRQELVESMQVATLYRILGLHTGTKLVFVDLWPVLTLTASFDLVLFIIF